MFFEPRAVRKARKAGVEFQPHLYAESPSTGRGSFGDNKDDLVKLVGDDAIVTKAWKCFYKDFPSIIAFGRSKTDCANRLLSHFL